MLNKVCSMLSQVFLNEILWAEALHLAAHLQDMLPSGDKSSTPLDVLSGEKPDAGNLNTFGCLVQKLVPD